MGCVYGQVGRAEIQARPSAGNVGNSVCLIAAPGPADPLSCHKSS